MIMDKIRTPLLFSLYGADYIEAYRLDSFLKIFLDEQPRCLGSLAGTLKEHDRVLDKLIRDGYLKENDGMYEITSEGLLFYGEGGYSARFLTAKRASISFWISIVSIIIAAFSLIISLRH